MALNTVSNELPEGLVPLESAQEVDDTIPEGLTPLNPSGPSRDTNPHNGNSVIETSGDDNWFVGFNKALMGASTPGAASGLPPTTKLEETMSKYLAYTIAPVFEVPAALGTGVFDFAKTAIQATSEAAGTDEEEAPAGTFAKYFEENIGKYTYQPRAETSQLLVDMVALPFVAMHKAGDLAFEHMFDVAEKETHKQMKLFMEGKERSPEELRFMARSLTESLEQKTFDANTTKIMIQALPQALLPIFGRKLRELRTSDRPDAAKLVNEGEMIIGRDTRNIEDIKKDAFVVTPGPADVTVSKEGVNVTYRPTTATPKFRDMPSWSSHRVQLLPGKFQAEKNPIVKGIVDTVDYGRLVSDRMSERLLFNPKAEGPRAKMKPQDGGGLTRWSKLSQAQQAKIAKDMRLLEEEMTMEPSGHTLKKVLGWDDDMITAFRDIRGMLDNTIKTYNSYGKRWGPEEFKALEPKAMYFPHVWSGEFRVMARRKGDSSPAMVFGASNRISAAQLKTGMEGKLSEMGLKPADFEIAIVQRKAPGSRDTAVEAFSTVRRHMEGIGESETAALLAKVHQDVIKSKGYRQFTMERGDTRGFLGDPIGAKSDKALAADFEKALRMHVTGAVRSGVNFRVDRMLNKFREDMDIRRGYPNSLKYGELYVANARGMKSDLDQIMQGGVMTPIEWLMGHNAIDKMVGGVSTATLYSKLFLHKMTFLAAQAVQPLQVIPAKLSQLQGVGFRGNVGNAMAKAYASLIKPDKEVRAILEYARHERVIEPQFIEQFLSEEYLHTPATRTKKAVSWVLGKELPAKIEEGMRMQAFLSFYHFLRESGVDELKAQQGAAYMAPKYMVEYHRAEKPLMYTHGVTRGAGQFKTFMANYFAQAVEHVKHAKNTGDVVPASMFLGNNIMTAGMNGMIGIGNADYLLEKLGQPTLTQYVLENTPDIVAYGPLQALTGISAPTIEAPSLDTRTLFSMPGLEYFAGGVTASYDLIKSWASNTLTSNDWYKLAKVTAPASMQGFVEEWFETGKVTLSGPDDGVLVHNPKLRGAGMSIRTNKDWWARRMGGRPLDEARIMQAMAIQTKLEEKRELNKQSLSDYASYVMMRNALHNEPIPNLDFLVEKSIELNDSPSSFWSRVHASRQRMYTQFLERASKLTTKSGRNNFQALTKMQVDYEKEVLGRRELTKTPNDEVPEGLTPLD